MTVRTFDWQQLVIDTLRDPKGAAEQILTYSLSRQTLYTALLAVAALNALISGAMQQLFPSPFELPPLLSNPLSLFVLVAVSLVIMGHLLFWAGRAMGGQGTLEDVLVLVIWLQALRVLAQVAVFVLSFIAPGLAGLLALGISLYGVYLLLHFISASLRFDSLARAAGVLIAVVVGLVLVLSFLLTLAGVGSLEVAGNV